MISNTRRNVLYGIGCRRVIAPAEEPIIIIIARRQCRMYRYTINSVADPDPYPGFNQGRCYGSGSGSATLTSTLSNSMLTEHLIQICSSVCKFYFLYGKHSIRNDLTVFF
jgi:hypothetical protein